MTLSHVVIYVLRKPILSGPLESDIVTVQDMSEIATENKVYCKTKLCLTGKMYVNTRKFLCFYLHGILNEINDLDTSFLDCKHKHMMKKGTPPDRFGVLHRLLPT